MKKNTSFTLIELLVVIVIIGILASVIIVSTSSSVSKANIAKLKSFETSIQNNLAVNMVSAWDADHVEKNGSSWKLIDKWGNGNDGVFHNGAGTACSSASGSEACPQVVKDKAMGNVLSFDGVDDYVDCGNANKLTFITDFTISLWGKIDTKTTNPLIEFGAYYGGKKGIRMQVNELNKIYAFYGNGTARATAVDPNEINLNKNFFVTITRKGNFLYMYMNGKEVSASSEVSGKIIYNNDIRWIGKEGNNFINGIINDIKIYNEALSSAQIKQNYIAGLDSLLSKGLISQSEYNQKIINLASN